MFDFKCEICWRVLEYYKWFHRWNERILLPCGKLRENNKKIIKRDTRTYIYIHTHTNRHIHVHAYIHIYIIVQGKLLSKNLTIHWLSVEAVLVLIFFLVKLRSDYVKIILRLNSFAEISTELYIIQERVLVSKLCLIKIYTDILS